MNVSTHSTAALRRVRRLLAALVATSAALSCASEVVDPTTGNTPATLTALPRPLTATEVRVRDGANAFSFALLGAVDAAVPVSNVFISPLSASFALGMTMNGAASATFDEMQEALQLRGLSQSEMNAGYKSLIALLVALDPGVQFRIANSIWYRNGFSFQQPFFDTTGRYFYANVQGLNFSDRVGSLATINNWASLATNGRIQTVLDDIDKDDVMFVINALYFKGSWRERFNPAQTTDGVFTTTSGGAQPVRFMHRLGHMSYAETPTYQAVDLPYGNSAFSMTVVLPKTGVGVNTVANALTPESWQSLTASFSEREVDLQLPKIKLSYERQLNGDLESLGMHKAFHSGADFSRLSTADVFISFVKQNSFVEINEEGTEAAAVTTVGVHTTSAEIPYAVRVDHPYLLVIRERLSGTILFMGKIVAPPRQT